jgi:hypothetical protein
VRLRPTAGLAPGQFIQGGIQLAGIEGLADFDLLAALPPVGAGILEDILFRGFRRALLFGLFGILFNF